MAALLALLSAATWSVGDFLGGLAAQRSHTLMVTAISQVMGLLVVAIALPIMGVPAQGEALLLGAIAGIGGSGGLLFYFRALAIGPMGVTAPLSAVVGGGVPVIAGLVLGERPTALAFAGIALAVLATTLASRPAVDAVHDEEASAAARDRTRRGAIAAGLAGLLFGMFFIALDQAPDDAGLWPLLTARASGLTMLCIALLVVRPPWPDRRGVRLSAGAGVLDMGANTFFLLATQAGGLLALTSVLASLYPVGVVALAAVVLHERLSRVQLIGAGLALVAVVMIAA